MQKISITTNYDASVISNILESKLSFLTEKIDMNKYMKNKKTVNIIEFKVNEEDKLKIANGILNIILDVYQMNIIEKLIIEKFHFLSVKDVNYIKTKTFDRLKDGDYIQLGNLYRENVKSRILHEIMEYIKDNNSINIEGFINFRLRFFLEHIEMVIRESIEDLIMEREHEEFIGILQYFMEAQEPQMDLVNVKFDGNKYKLIDNNQNIINNDYLEEIAQELSDIDITYDDLLISSLITIAPREVVIHTNTEESKEEVINIIKDIFKDKVTIQNTSK